MNPPPPAEMMALVDAVTAVMSQPTHHTPNANARGSAPFRKRKLDNIPVASHPTLAPPAAKAKKPATPSRQNRRKDVSPARARRLEQNRLAAIESRRRKKVMIEELQRSVKFYSKANANLKCQNDDLQRRILIAKQKAQAIEDGTDRKQMAPSLQENVFQGGPKRGVASPGKPEELTSADVLKTVSPTASRPSPPVDAANITRQAQQAQFAATQALYESLGYPPGAARAAANTFSQFVCQNNASPLPDPPQLAPQTCVPSSAPTPTAAPAERTPHLVPEIKHPQPPMEQKEPEAKAETDPSNAYITALNKFAMQQAAAANAAAAAATAAIQAVNWHSKLKERSPSQPMPLFPFPLAQNHRPFPLPSLEHLSPKNQLPSNDEAERR